jgi:KDO2-lipid IV(A) lauroyltransferase
MFYLGLILLKLLALPLFFLPRPVFVRLGYLAGALVRRAGFREEIARANIELAFPEMRAEDREALLRQSFRELGVLWLELIHLFYRFDRFLDKYCDTEGVEHLDAARAGGKGAFVLTSHLGNWEVMAAAAPNLAHAPALMVTKRLKPAWLHRVFEVTRSLLKVRMALEPRTVQDILRALKRNDIVGMVMDQYAGAPVGARVPFFGKPVGSQTALALLALRTGAPVVPAFAVRRPNGRYLVRFEPALKLEERGDPDATVLANTALFVRHVEGWIRQYPAQWLWIHRRWKGDLSPLPSGSEGEMLK